MPCSRKRDGGRRMLEIERREPNMLVLSRNKGQEIVIGEDISIVILEVRGERVRVGIDAPAEIPVHRREVKDAIDKADPARKIGRAHV